MSLVSLTSKKKNERPSSQFFDYDAWKEINVNYSSSGSSNPDVFDYDSWKKNRISSDAMVFDYDTWKANGGMMPGSNATDRGTLDRIFGVLGNNSIIEGLYNITDDDPNTTFGQGLIDGVKFMNPFEDDVSGRHTFSDVLQNVGWEDKDPDKLSLSDVGRGVVGFAGDIVLDPMSYINPFSSAGKVLKGSGVTLDIAKAGDKVDDLIKAGGKLDDVARVGKKIDDISNPASNIEKLKNLSPYTMDDARKIVSNFEGYKTPKMIEEAAENLMYNYNKNIMRASTSNGDGLVVGLKHLPFMERRTQALNKTIISDKKLREFGDKTVAPYYNSLMKKIRTSSLGQKFSVKNQLEALAYTDGLDSLAKYHVDELLKGFKRLDLDLKDINTATQIQDYWEKLSSEDQYKWLQAYETGGVKRAKEFSAIRERLQDAYEKTFSKNRDDIFNDTELFSDNLQNSIDTLNNNPRNKYRVKDMYTEIENFLKVKADELGRYDYNHFKSIFGSNLDEFNGVESIRSLRSYEKLNSLPSYQKYTSLMNYYKENTSRFPELRQKLAAYTTEDGAYKAFLDLPNSTKNALVDSYTHSKEGSILVNQVYSDAMRTAKNIEKHNARLNDIFKNSDQYHFYKILDELSGTSYMDDMRSLDDKLSYIASKNDSLAKDMANYKDLGEEEGIEIAKIVQSRMREIGQEEMRRGLLSEEQFEKLDGKYLYHFSKEDYNTLASLLKEDKPGAYNPDLLGILKRFDAHRSGGTIAEINKAGTDQEREILSTALHEIYLSRCLKGNRLVYGTDVQDYIRRTFGKSLNFRDPFVADKGYTIVAKFDDIESKFRMWAKNFAESEIKPEKFKSENEYEKALAECISDNFNDMRERFLSLGAEKAATDFAPNISMQKLTKEQCEFLANNFGDGKYKIGMFQINDNILDRTNVMSRAQKMEHQNHFLNLYDKWLNRWKLWNSLAAPSFYVQNAASNAYQSFLGVGADALNIKQIQKAWDVIRLRDPKQTIKLGDKVWTYKELEYAARRSGVLDELFSTYEFGKQGKALSSLDSVKFNGLKSLNPINTDENTWLQLSTVIGTNIESVQRMNLFMSGLKQGKSIDEAAGLVDEFLFNYGALTDFEQDVMKRVIPFYTFMRKNIPMELEQMLERPQLFKNMERAITNFEKLDGEGYKEENERNEWRQDYIQIPYTDWGVNPQLPYQQLDKFSLNDEHIPNKIIGSMNPLLKAAYELPRSEYAYTGIEIDNPLDYLMSQTIPTSYFSRTDINDKDSVYGTLSKLLGFPAGKIK